jgi:hypothetical protein
VELKKAQTQKMGGKKIPKMGEWDGWVGGLGAVGASSIFGLVRGAGAFAAVLPTFVLVSRTQLAERYRGNVTSFSVSSSSRVTT